MGDADGGVADPQGAGLMARKSLATPRPWRVAPGTGNEWWVRSEATGWSVCSLGHVTANHSLPDGELIVRAVNAHDELVAACEEVLAATSDEADITRSGLEALGALSVALRKARGEE